MKNLEVYKEAYYKVLPSLKSPYNCHILAEKILAGFEKRQDLADDIIGAEPNELYEVIEKYSKKYESEVKKELTTHSHCKRVADLAGAIAYKLYPKQSEDFIQKQIYQAALVHDIGKLFNGKYNSDKKMNDCEKAEHVVIGCIIVAARELTGRPLSPKMKDAIAHHHCRPYNGNTSYPCSPHQIEHSTEIIQPADTWDRMKYSNYQSEYPDEEIIEHLINGMECGLYGKDAAIALIEIKKYEKL
jgi:putative nucleotidyltransferase with HDIG domain